MDNGSFKVTHGNLYGELVGGTGTIDGVSVSILAINPDASVNIDPFEVIQQEIGFLDMVEKEKIPLIYLADRPKRILMETTEIPTHIMTTFINPNGVGKIFSKFAKLSGVVPRISVVFNSIATTLTYPVAECDVLVMVENSGMSLARPDIVRLMTGDESSYEDYAGAKMHSEISGTCHVVTSSEKEALNWVKDYLGFFPSNYLDLPPIKNIINIEAGPKKLMISTFQIVLIFPLICIP